MPPTEILLGFPIFISSQASPKRGFTVVGRGGSPQISASGGSGNTKLPSEPPASSQGSWEGRGPAGCGRGRGQVVVAQLPADGEDRRLVTSHGKLAIFLAVHPGGQASIFHRAVGWTAGRGRRHACQP